MRHETAEAALAEAGDPPSGFDAWPINYGFAKLGPMPPVEIVGNIIRLRPRPIFNYNDWRVWFVPKSLPEG